MKQVDIMILGGGVTGLAAALKAYELGREAVIYEARSSPGGLLDNFVVNGFLFDHAVHLSFATETEVRKIFDQTEYLTHPATAYCFDDSVWLKHPVQNNLYPLKAEEKVSLIKSFIERPSISPIDNYEEWLRHQYGNKIAEKYPIRYTRKYWQTEADKLSTDWIGNRMRRTPLEEVLLGAFTDQTPNDYYVKTMRYPKSGGFKSFIKPLIELANISLDYQAIAIDLKNKTVEFKNGEIVRYKSLINTLPLPIFIGLCRVAPHAVRAAASQLRATSIDLISVGFNKKIKTGLWFYIYDEDIYASRAYSPSIKSPLNAPEGCSSLQFEIYNPGQISQYIPQVLIDNVLYALRKMNMANDEDIAVLHHKHIKWGNVVFDLGMEERRALVRKFLYQHGIKSCGRFGEWDYLWSHQSFLSGYRAL